MSKRPTISAIIITKNESDNIEDCLKSICWADEIIVLDSGSTDQTVELARKFTDKVFGTDWPGFGPQKNRALDKATMDWVLSIDADERVSKELKEEILANISNQTVVAYKIPRRSSFCGKFLRHGGWWPDYVTRLFRRDSAKFSDSLVHERVIPNGKLEKLNSPIIHYTYRSPEDVTRLIHAYSSAGAKQLIDNNRNSSLSIAVFHAFWAFIRTFFLRAGLLDGKEGFMLAVSNAEVTYYKYLKAYYLKKGGS